MVAAYYFPISHVAGRMVYLSHTALCMPCTTGYVMHALCSSVHNGCMWDMYWVLNYTLGACATCTVQISLWWGTFLYWGNSFPGATHWMHVFYVLCTWMYSTLNYMDEEKFTRSIFGNSAINKNKEGKAKNTYLGKKFICLFGDYFACWKINWTP